MPSLKNHSSILYTKNSYFCCFRQQPENSTFEFCPFPCMKTLFQRMKCFIYEPCTEKKKLFQVEILQNDDLHPEFVQAESVPTFLVTSQPRLSTEASKSVDLVRIYWSLFLRLCGKCKEHMSLLVVPMLTKL